MNNIFLTCESCHGRKPFLMHEQELEQARNGKAIQKHCPTCRTMTHWLFAHEDRRSGADRRQPTDRRT